MPHKRVFHFESKKEAILSERLFLRRMVRNFLVASTVIFISLFGGILGYHLTEGMSWIDSFANASMILSGMGPLDPLKTTAGKLFAGCYALYSGLVLVLASGIILAPVLHRMLHRFHIESEVH